MLKSQTCHPNDASPLADTMLTTKLYLFSLKCPLPVKISNTTEEGILNSRRDLMKYHRSPVNSPHKGQWRGALMFSLICVWIKGWVNNREACDLRRHRAHCHVIVILKSIIQTNDEPVARHISSSLGIGKFGLYFIEDDNHFILNDNCMGYYLCIYPPHKDASVTGFPFLTTGWNCHHAHLSYQI